MYLHLVLAQLQTADYKYPSVCPKQGCDGAEFRLHQQVIKPLRDSMYPHVVVYRYQCLRCRGTFRVYPRGVTHAHTSRQVQEVAVLLYFLGLSFGAVSAALDVFGVYMSKSRVHDAVKCMQSNRPDLWRVVAFEAIQRRPLQRGVLDVRCIQQWLPLTFLTDGRSQLVLDVSTLPRDTIACLSEQISPLITRMDGRLLIADAHSAGGEDTASASNQA